MEKVVKIFKEFKDVYSKFVYSVDEPFRESYKFPEMIYSIPRGENVIARIWKDGKYDYILLVNMDRKKDVVTYNFTKPSNKTCIEIMSGANKKDIIQNNANNIVSIKISYIGVVWLRGYDNDGVCDKVKLIDPKTFKEITSSSSNHIWVIFLIIIMIIIGIVLYLYFTKKLCFSKGFNFNMSLNKIGATKLLDY